jgi:hypothetical protein
MIWIPKLWNKGAENERTGRSCIHTIDELN